MITLKDGKKVNCRKCRVITGACDEHFDLDPARVANEVKERMSPGFAVFNLHVNDAGKRADEEFILQFSKSIFEKTIEPLRKSGIMAIFNEAVDKSGNPDKTADILRAVWITLVTVYVNEDRRVLK